VFGYEWANAAAILDPVLELMMEAVHRYEGTVNQVMGDGIMALFGAPVAHEDHAVRACYAAIHMQDTVRGYAEEVFHSHGTVLQIRVGLNSGEVVVRSLGSDLRMDRGPDHPRRRADGTVREPGQHRADD
jgi:class 3 adenylate cyclase